MDCIVWSDFNIPPAVEQPFKAAMPAFERACESFAPTCTLRSLTFYSRRLPHWQPEGKSLFLTWHLRGSLPHNRFPPPGALTAGQAFVWMDRYLDEARVGPTWLKREEIAAVVQESIHYAADQLSYCSLHAYVIMANHVHVLVTPLVSPSKLLQSVKGYSAREANKLLERTGQPFWQTESYD